MATRTDFWRNILARSVHRAQRQLVAVGLPDLNVSEEVRVLSLAEYFQKSPQQLFDKSASRQFTEILHDLDERHPLALRNYLQDHESELSKAYFFLHEVNSLEWHDQIDVDGEFQELRFVDQELHPTYLRLLEAVFYPFAHLVAHFSRLDRRKPTEGLDLFNAVSEISKILPAAAARYNNTMRNGIAHGGITFGSREVQYRDKRGTTITLSLNEIVREFDDLLDFTNAAALALAAFLLTQTTVSYPIPQQLLLNELRAETESPWWSIDGCVATRTAGGRQLIVYAKPRTRDFTKVQFYSYLTAILAEELAPGFDRYFLSLRSPIAHSGFAAFSGSRLREVRETGPTSYADYAGVLEDNLLFFVPRVKLPKALGRIDSLLQSFAIHWPLAIAEIRRELASVVIDVRNAKIHRNGFWCILNGAVVLRGQTNDVLAADVRKVCRKIVTQAWKRARQLHPMWSPVRWLPLGWARIAVFQRDFRKRRLASFGLGPDLVCTVQRKRLARVQAPDIMDAHVEEHRGIRIAWNRAWLEGRA